MEERALRGIPWTLLSYASNRTAQLVTTVVLGRLLAPADFGLVALATLAIGALILLNDLGLGSVLVVRQDLDERAKGTVLTLLLATYTLVTGVVAALAPLVAELFDEGRLTGVLRALALTLLFGSVTWFYETLLQRELEFRKRFVARIAQTTLYGLVSISLAVLGAGVWSLVAGQAAGVALYTVLLVSLAPYHVRPAFDRAAARDLIATGRGYLVQSAVSFLKYNTDYLAVGRMFGAAQVGFYSMAYRLGEQTYWAIADPVAKVTFPAFARMRHRGEDVTRSFLSALRAVALVACPLGLLMSGAAEPFTRAVFGDKWLPMIGPLSVLGVWAAVRPLQSTVEWFLNSVEMAGPLAVIDAALFVPQAAGLFFAASRFGITAVAWVMLAHAVLALVVLGAFLESRRIVRLRPQWAALRPVAIAGVAAWAAARGLAEAMAGSAPALALGASLAAGGAAYLGAARLTERGMLAQTLAQVRRALGRTPAGVPGS